MKNIVLIQNKAAWDAIKKSTIKKILALAASFLLVLSVTACSHAENNGMSIRPSEFSEESLKILDLFDDKLQFFDVMFDETAKAYTMSIWAYRDDEWHEDGTATGEVARFSNQIAIELTNDSCEVFMMEEDGHISYAFPSIETDFKNSMGIGGSRIDRKIPIECNKEIPIWVKIGTENGNISAMDITQDFRMSDCNAGIAVTLTVSDKIAE